MREDAESAGERHERRIGGTAGVAQQTRPLAFLRAVHRTDLPRSNAGTALGLLMMIGGRRVRAAQRHRRDTDGRDLAAEPDDGDGPKDADRTHDEE